jgi:hypothetical protein
VAVKVTDWLTTDGLGEEVRAVVVEMRVTTWVTMFEVLVAKVPETPW